ncbi:Alkaline phosphatase (EC [uncultured Gammaproteobacteria bacterium]|nr:Alkaline phosphatase (EC [uncultured Gammaproteobacteria bacterium]
MLQYILQSAMPLAKRQHRLKRVCFYMNKQQVSIAAGTDNQGRETAEFVGSLIGGFFGVLGGGGWGSAILGAIGSKYGGDIAEEIYDYFTNSVQAAQANPQIATDLGIDINSAIEHARVDSLQSHADIQALEGLVDGSTILVKNGDTLSQIAQDNGLSLNELLALNPKYKANPDDVKAGALLILKDNAGTQSLSDYLKEHTDDPQAVSALIDSLKTELQAASVIRSPLTLDLDGDGMVETTSKENSGVYFDHDNNSFAEQSGWVGKDDGLLVFDKNNNGKIDDGSELFGNNTILSNGNKAANGFEALKDLDTNNDGKVDSQDSNFSSLKIWQDKNSDGKLDKGELLSLGETGVRSLNTTYSNSNEVDSSNNAYKQQGSFTTTAGTDNKMNDVWFDVDNFRKVA